MFYSQFVLSKKGPLSKIWLAAHWERKLSKAQIFETNVQEAVDEILQPKVKLSLRTTGHLLLGIVRIYSRKAKYVLADCNEAFLKIKMAFRPGRSENELREKETHDVSVDIPDVIHDFYDALPDINDFPVGNLGNFQVNQTRIDDITLQEDRFETSSQRNLAFDAELGLDDFGEREQNLQRRTENDFFNHSNNLDAEFARRASTNSDRNDSLMERSLLKDDEINKPKEQHLFDDFNDGVGTAMDLDEYFNDVTDLDRAQAPGATPAHGLNLNEEEIMEVDHITEGVIPETQESFQLEPLDQNAMEQPKNVRQKRKRRFMLDEQRNISGDDMKANMSDYSDTIMPFDFAPPTKILMRIKENTVAEKLFIMPGCSAAIQNNYFIRLYQSHLVLRSCGNDENEDIRRDLGLAENLEDDLSIYHDEEYALSPPRENGYLNNDENDEGDENQEPDDRETPVPVVITPEKRSITRKSRVIEKDNDLEEEDEQMFTKRTKAILNSIVVRLRATENTKIKFEDLFTRGSTRRSTAQKFYALLELHKLQAIEVEQHKPFGDIEIMPGSRMEERLTA